MIERIEALIEKATPGPWECFFNCVIGGPGTGWGIKSERIETLADFVDDDSAEADADLAAHARQLLPLMAAELEAWRKAFGGPEDRYGFVRETGLALDAYCAEYLPEKK